MDYKLGRVAVTLPEHSLSTVPVIDEYLSPDDRDRTVFIDYERGGIALYDTTEGILYQNWKMTYTDGSVYATPDNTGIPVALFAMAGITECSMTFDKNMNPFVAYMIGSASWIWWYDSEVATQVHTQLPVGAVNPRCSLDDKRRRESASSDVILAYMMGSSLYTREQRDRFGVTGNTMTTPDPDEYLMLENIPEEQILYKVGMGEGNRFLFSWLSGAPPINYDLYNLMISSGRIGWIDLSRFPTVTFEDLFGQSIDDPDFTKVVNIGDGVKILMQPSAAGPVNMYVVDSLDMNQLQMMAVSVNGSIDGYVYYSGWETDNHLSFFGAYDSWLVIASDTGKARLRKMDESPVVPDYGDKVDPQYGWLQSNPEITLSVVADLQVVNNPLEDIAGLTVFLDPTDISTMFQDAAGTIPVTADGQPLGLWLDKSGLDNHFYADAGLEAYAYPTAGYVDFDDTSNRGRLYTTSLTAITSGELFIRLEMDSIAGSKGFHHIGSDFALNNHYPYVPGGNLIYDGFGCSSRQSMAVSGHDYLIPHTVDLSQTANQLIFLINGVTLATKNTTTSFSTTARLGWSLGNPIDGRMYMVALYNRKLDTGERAIVKAYMDSFG